MIADATNLHRFPIRQRNGLRPRHLGKARRDHSTDQGGQGLVAGAAPRTQYPRRACRALTAIRPRLMSSLSMWRQQPAGAGSVIAEPAGGAVRSRAQRRFRSRQGHVGAGCGCTLNSATCRSAITDPAPDRRPFERPSESDDISQAELVVSRLTRPRQALQHADIAFVALRRRPVLDRLDLWNGLGELYQGVEVVGEFVGVLENDQRQVGRRPRSF